MRSIMNGILGDDDDNISFLLLMYDEEEDEPLTLIAPLVSKVFDDCWCKPVMVRSTLRFILDAVGNTPDRGDTTFVGIENGFEYI